MTLAAADCAPQRCHLHLRSEQSGTVVGERFSVAGSAGERAFVFFSAARRGDSRAEYFSPIHFFNTPTDIKMNGRIVRIVNSPAGSLRVCKALSLSKRIL